MDNLQRQFDNNPGLEEEIRNSALGVDSITNEENPNFNYDNEYPNLSVLIPTYNRRKFLPLMGVNLSLMDYPKDKLEVVIFDDHPDNPLFLNNDEVNEFQRQINIQVIYIYDKSKKLTIGAKRNKLVKASRYKICINLDDDDLYFPSYFKHSINILRNNKCGLVASNEMMFCFPDDDFKITGISCPEKRMAHEGTFCFTKKYWRNMNGFSNAEKAEGVKMIDGNEKNVAISNIRYIMLCICHQENSVSKDQFNKEEYKLENVMTLPDQYKSLIRDILKKH
jgi:cellulose synthase/poly-beta-1,6-N-acetylglucosamine synthase-like glycosyltransferase